MSVFSLTAATLRGRFTPTDVFRKHAARIAKRRRRFGRNRLRFYPYVLHRQGTRRWDAKDRTTPLLIDHRIQFTERKFRILDNLIIPFIQGGWDRPR